MDNTDGGILKSLGNLYCQRDLIDRLIDRLMHLTPPHTQMEFTAHTYKHKHIHPAYLKVNYDTIILEKKKKKKKP